MRRFAVLALLVMWCAGVFDNPAEVAAADCTLYCQPRYILTPRVDAFECWVPPNNPNNCVPDNRQGRPCNNMNLCQTISNHDVCMGPAQNKTCIMGQENVTLDCYDFFCQGINAPPFGFFCGCASNQMGTVAANNVPKCNTQDCVSGS